MARRLLPAALLALALLYPAFVAWSVAEPQDAALFAWNAARCARPLPAAGGALALLLYFLAPPFGEAVRDILRAVRAQLVLDRREIPELLRSAEEIDSVFYWQKLGEAWFRRYFFFEAEEALRRAAAKSPKDPAVVYPWGLSLLKLRRFEEAAAVLEHAHALDPAHDVSYVKLHLAEALLRAGRTAEGTARAREFLAASAGHPRGHYILARLLAQSGDRGGARAEMEALVRAVRLAPDFARREHRFLARRARWFLIFFPARRGKKS